MVGVWIVYEKELGMDISGEVYEYVVWDRSGLMVFFFFFKQKTAYEITV